MVYYDRISLIHQTPGPVDVRFVLPPERAMRGPKQYEKTELGRVFYGNGHDYRKEIHMSQATGGRGHRTG
jgi:hypothetical protein